MREGGTLQVIGIVQEQHPDRALLYQEWQEFDWPILWDPFNLTGSLKVPNVVFVDAHGIVRSTKPRQDTFEDELLFAEFPVPAGAPPELVSADHLVQLDNPRIGGFDRAHYTALSDLLWRREGKIDEAVEALAAHAAKYPDDAALTFRAGVAHRLRYDSSRSVPGDFQAAADGWTNALAKNPRQYIWRRRIQQYGPRLDKPYPFYTWVDEARAAITARGGTPPELVASLTPAELAVKRGGDAPPPEDVAPDPTGEIPRDEGLLSVESAVAFQTAGNRAVASVHVAFRPVAAKDAHWNNEAEPMVVWFEDPALPEGWSLDARLVQHPSPPTATSNEVRRFSVEFGLPPDIDSGVLRGYALFHACEGESGTCLYLRRDFEVAVRRPRH